MYSTTQFGSLGQIVSMALILAGFSKEDADLQAASVLVTIGLIGHIVSFVIAWYGRWKKGDINIFGFKK